MVSECLAQGGSRTGAGAADSAAVASGKDEPSRRDELPESHLAPEVAVRHPWRQHSVALAALEGCGRSTDSVSATCTKKLWGSRVRGPDPH